jgi:hypothetical protein
MGRADFWEPGSWNVICDRTGRKYKRSQCETQWDGLIVRKESWEARQPQDLLRAFPDHQAVPAGEANPPGDDYFLSDNEVTVDDL